MINKKYVTYLFLNSKTHQSFFLLRKPSLRRAESFTESGQSADPATSSKFDSLRRSTHQLIRKTTTAAAAADSRTEKETTANSRPGNEMTADSRSEVKEAAGRTSTAFMRENSHNQEVIFNVLFTDTI